MIEFEFRIFVGMKGEEIMLTSVHQMNTQVRESISSPYARLSWNASKKLPSKELASFSTQFNDVQIRLGLPER